MELREKILQLLARLRAQVPQELLCDHIQYLLESGFDEQRRIEDLYGELLTSLLRAVADPQGELQVLAEVVDCRPSEEELQRLGPVLRRLTETAPPLRPAPPAQAAEEAVPVWEQEANGVYRRHLDERSREIGELQRRLDGDISEAVRQNQQAGELLEGLLSRFQLAETMPAGSGELADVVLEIDQLLQAYRGINQNLERTRSSLRGMADNTDRLHEELSRVRTLSLTDELTRLANRRAFQRELESELARAERYRLPLAVALLDLDHFKAINDVHGHAVGDAVLRCYAERVLVVLRRQDVVARYGGEEFAIVFPNTPPDGAIAALEKVRGRAAKQTVALGEGRLPLPTFSAGVTGCGPADGVEAIMRRADSALYRAKHSGRDRIEVADEAAGRAQECSNEE